MTALKIFVTGASGFIGQSLVIKMLEQGYHIVAAHGPLSPIDLFDALPHQHQSNLSNLKLDLLNQQELLPNISGCDCVVHLAHNFQDTLQEQFAFATHSTQTLLQACVEAHVKKFIHISSTSVYGDPPPSCVITEESPRLASLIPLTSIKQAAERLVLEAGTGDTEVIVLQLGRVYGPGARGETARTLSQMKAAFMTLARYGTGYCNPIYIDDAITAIICACEIPNLHRQSFIISNDKPISWKEFLSCYESILNEKTLINLPIDYFCEAQASVPFFRGLISKILTKRKVMEGTSTIARALCGKSIRYLSPDEFCTLAAQPIFCNQKSHDLLNFQPKISLEVGIKRIREWWYQQSLETK
jgi:nucleoside-diphosphate-sugar epimerase